jgi:hypothetical protein
MLLIITGNLMKINIDCLLFYSINIIRFNKKMIIAKIMKLRNCFLL